ncbi:MAG: hypothetical protein ABFC77_11035 [Thermoguttaceae bacterium]
MNFSQSVYSLWNRVMRTDTRYFIFPGLPAYWERIGQTGHRYWYSWTAECYPEYWAGTGMEPDNALQRADELLKERLAQDFRVYGGADNWHNPLCWCRKGYGRYKAAKLAAHKCGQGPCCGLVIDHHPWNPEHGELAARLQGSPVILPGLPIYWHLLLGCRDDTHELIAKCYPEYWASCHFGDLDPDAVNSFWQQADEHLRNITGKYSTRVDGISSPTNPNIALPPQNPLYWIAIGHDRYAAAKLAAFKGGVGPLNELVIDHHLCCLAMANVTHDRFPLIDPRNIVLDVDDSQSLDLTDPDADEPDDSPGISDSEKFEQATNGEISHRPSVSVTRTKDTVHNTRHFDLNDFPRFDVS